MGFLKIFELGFLGRKKIKTQNKIPMASAILASEEIQRTFGKKASNEPLADVTQKTPVSPRLEEPEIQSAIRKFNNLSIEEKNSILESADKRLQEKLVKFMNQNAVLMSGKDYVFTFRNIDEKITELKNSNYDKESLEEITEQYQELLDDVMVKADAVISAFSEYKNNNHNLLSDDPNYAINKSNNFKQSMLSYSLLVESKIKELQKAPDNQKEIYAEELRGTINRIKKDVEKFKSDASDLMNDYIPEAVSSKNQFYASINKYKQTDIPKDLNLENKVCENVLLDTLVDTLEYTGAKLY